MSKIALSDKQREIVNFTEGALLVKANAGSGKTRVLTERIKCLAQHTKRQVLAITFTNKACDEIKHRLSEENLESKVFVSTFHGLCMSILEEKIAYTRFKEMPYVFSVEDRKTILKDTILENPTLKEWFTALNEKERKSKINEGLEVISRIKRNVITDSDLVNYCNENMVNLYINYREHLDSLNAIDFDDLLLLVYNLFMNESWITEQYRRKYTYICIDEAQDLNKAQYMLIKALTGDSHKNVMLVGDPNQSIYGFNGSSSTFMTEDFKKDYEPIEFDLNENYRSAKKILLYANRIIEGSDQIDCVPFDGVLEVNEYESPQIEAESIISKIKELCNSKRVIDIEGKIGYDDFAVLARNKYTLSEVEKVLISNNIPYYYKTSTKGPDCFSTSAIVYNLALCVRINKNDRLHLDELSSLMKLTDKNSLEEIYSESHDTFNGFIISKVLETELNGSNFKTKVEEIIEVIKQQKFSIDEQESLFAFEEFNALKVHWNVYAKHSNVLSLNNFKNAMMLGQTAPQEKNNGVILSTVHTMKGQQSLIVFLIGMDDKTFPDYRAIQKGGTELEQEKNNLYVAVTRAQRHLYISYPNKRVKPWGDISYRKKSRLLPKD